MATILVNGKPWEYEKTSYNDDLHAIDHEDAQKLIVNIKKVLDKHHIFFMPMFGTLLGIVRDHAFIKNDHDMDLVIYEKDCQALINLIPEFYQNGIVFTRCSEPWIYTFKMGGADCDIYIIKDAGWFYRWRYYRIIGCYIPKFYFKDSQKVTFLGELFDIPLKSECLLTYFYGKNWRIPSSRQAKIQTNELIHINIYRFYKRCINYIKRHFFNKRQQ